jgi:hypothetical protein
VRGLPVLMVVDFYDGGMIHENPNSLLATITNNTPPPIHSMTVKRSCRMQQSFWMWNGKANENIHVESWKEMNMWIGPSISIEGTRMKGE